MLAELRACEDGLKHLFWNVLNLKYVHQESRKLLFADSLLIVFAVLLPEFVDYSLDYLVSCGLLFSVDAGTGVELDELR